MTKTVSRICLYETTWANPANDQTERKSVYVEGKESK